LPGTTVAVLELFSEDEAAGDEVEVCAKTAVKKRKE